MAFFLDRYLTQFDESLSGASYIDPVGTLVIWSAFGRQIFGNRINSISNDVRNYTLNLFHHFLVRSLVNDDAAVLSRSLQKKYQDKDTLHFKQACLIFLENLFVYSIVEHEKMDGVAPGGVIGISNARKNWEADDGRPVLKFTHEPGAQILVRQLGLGVSGRYKSPLMDIGFFDSSYNYNKPVFHARWAAADAFIKDGHGPLRELAHMLYAFLKECAATLSDGGELSFADAVPRELTTAYATVFASPFVVGGYARGFWLAQTELDSGAAGALLTVLETERDTELAPRDMLERALRGPLEPADQARLQDIMRLEPFLADCALLFNLMAAERTHTLADVARQWQRFGRDDDRLPQLAHEVQSHPLLPAVKGSAAGQRLIELRNVANGGDLGQQIRGLSDYHARVMRSRGQASWLSVENDGTIMVSARTMRRPTPESWLPGTWYNEYYLPQFRSFVNGLRGVGA
jgi:hypothetical protein